MSTPVRIVKLPCDGSAPWDNTGVRTMDFNIPADLGVIDMDKSYVLLQINATSTEVLDEHVGALRPVGIAGGNTDIPAYDSDCLIVNSYLHSERAGRLEDGNDINVLNQALSFYGRSGEDIQSATVYNGAFQFDEYQRPHSNFRDLLYLGNPDCTTLPDNRDTAVLQPEIRIPLSKVAKFADGMTQCPMFALGDTLLHLELQDNTVPVMYVHSTDAEVEFLPVDNDADVFTVRARNHHVDPGSFPYYIGCPVTVTYNTTPSDGSGGSLAVTPDTTQIVWYCSDPDFVLASGTINITGVEIDNVLPAGQEAEAQALDLDLIFTNPAEDAANPFNQTLMTITVNNGSAGLFPGTTFTYNQGDYVFYFEIVNTDQVGPQAPLLQTIITGLTYDNVRTDPGGQYTATTGEVQITFRDPLPADNNTFSQGVISVPAPAFNVADYSVIQANLVVNQLLLSDAQMVALQNNVNAGIQIPYMVWDRQNDNVINGETSYGQTFPLPPMCGNVIFQKPATGTIVGDTDDVEEFRFWINTTETTDRAIVVREPLYHDRIIDTWSNMNKDLRNLDEEYSLDTTETQYNIQPMIMCQPVPLMPSTSQITIQATANGMSSGLIKCYKQKQRVLKLSGQTSQIIN